MIIGIEGSFRLEMGWQFPTHKDFKLVTFDEAKRLDLNDVEVYDYLHIQYWRKAYSGLYYHLFYML